MIGNPPYKGGKTQTEEMKADYPFVFGGRPYSKNLDYIALWFVKGADYIEGTRPSSRSSPQTRSRRASTSG